MVDADGKERVEIQVIGPRQDVSPQFKIGGGDTITLRDTLGGAVTQVSLPDSSLASFDVTYAWNEAAAAIEASEESGNDTCVTAPLRLT